MLIGAAAGLGCTAVLAVLLFVAGLRTDATGETAVYIFAQFTGQFFAGVVGGRLGRPHEVYHGSQAALALYATTAILTLAAGGSPGPAVLALSGVVALVIGAAGGVLAGAAARPPRAGNTG